MGHIYFLGNVRPYIEVFFRFSKDPEHERLRNSSICSLLDGNAT